MKESDSNRYAVTPQNSGSFGPDLALECQFLTQPSSKYVYVMA
jgi:hypothetical protein